MKQILVITGPTASGKSDFAVECAKLFNGEIVSSDSMQIYKDLDIGTAKPTVKEMQGIKHYLIDEVNANEEFSVSDFVNKAEKYIDDIISRGKLPIIVGGTGLYIKSLLYPHSFCDAPKDEQIRQKYNRLLATKGKEYIYSLLQEKDMEASKTIHINDTKRAIRALEIYDITGKKKSELNNQDNKNIKYDTIFIALTMDRKILYKRIDLRVDKMFDYGLLQEVENLLSHNKVNKDCQSMQAIGYKELFNYFDGKHSLDETKELIKQDSRHYAKRQLTFIRGFKDAKTFDILTEKNKIIDYIKEKRGIK